MLKVLETLIEYSHFKLFLISKNVHGFENLQESICSIEIGNTVLCAYDT